jgi:multidrug efflux pump subunit AcrA (membrane-fusion protein)
VLLIDQSGALDGSLQAPVMRLEIPPYDRRTISGILDAWYVQSGQEIKQGDKLADVSFDGLSYKVDLDSADQTGKSSALRARRRRDKFSAVLVMQVLAGSDGYVYQTLIPEGTRIKVGDTAAVITPERVDDAGAVDDSTPTFRLGLRVKEL